MPDDDDILQTAMTVEVPDEDVGDTNFAPQPKKAEGGPVGEDDLRRQIASLQKKARDSEKRATEVQQQLGEAQRRATEEIRQSREAAATSRRSQVDTARGAIEAMISEADAAMKEAKAAYQRAFEAGDSAAVADAQERMIQINGSRQENLRRRDALPSEEQLKTEEEQITQPKDPSKMTNQEKFEAYVTQFNPASQNWLRKHPECVTDTRLNRKILRLHQEATEDHGMEPESEDYFAFIDGKMGYGPVSDREVFDDGGGDRALRANPRVARQETPKMPQGSDGGGRQYTPNRAQTSITRAAPVRGGDTARAVMGGKREVALTQGEIEQATDGTIYWLPHDAPKPNMVGEPIGVNEMARRKMLMQKAGRYMNTGE